jgi:NAD(P)-dependent dehydrogenase (short-subunit alcohol dehydrogenase family)
MFSLQGKTALITGSTGAIGRALVQGFLDAGARVLPVAINETEGWGPVVNGNADNFLPLVCDLSRELSARQLANLALEAVGGNHVDVLLNAAAVNPPAPGDPYDYGLLRQIMTVGFEAAYQLCGIFAPLMAEKGGGSIINISSLNAERAWPGNPAYVTAKAAVRLLTKAVARDFGGQNVRANNLCPGYIRTAMTAVSYADPVANEDRRSRTMLGRWGEPADLVGPAVFLASDAARYVTGIDLHVDGGWSAKGM